MTDAEQLLAMAKRMKARGSSKYYVFTPEEQAVLRRAAAREAEVMKAHATLDRFGIAREMVETIDRRGKAGMWTMDLRARIEALHRTGGR